jgi:hypothetical protein
MANPTPAAEEPIPPPPATPPKPPPYVRESVEERESISSMISRVLAQTCPSEPPKPWSGAEQSPAVPTSPRGTRVMRYESSATLVAPSSEGHNPCDEVPLTILYTPSSRTDTFPVGAFL